MGYGSANDRNLIMNWPGGSQWTHSCVGDVDNHLETNNGFECLIDFCKHIDRLSNKSPDSYNFLNIQYHCGNEEPFRGKPFRIMSIFEFDKDMLGEHDGISKVSGMQLVCARWGVIEKDEVTRHYNGVVVRIWDGEDVIEGIYHDLPEPLGDLTIIDEVFGSLRGPMAIGTGAVKWWISELVP